MLKAAMWTGVGIGLVAGVVGIWYWATIAVFNAAGHDHSKAGQIGDMFGAVNALFSALAFVGVIAAILLQRQELQLQREELTATREELKRSAEAQEKSQAALMAQTEIMLQSALLAAADALCRSYSDEISNPQTTAIRAEGLKSYQVSSRRRLEQMLAALDSRHSTPVEDHVEEAEDDGTQADRRGFVLAVARHCVQADLAIQKIAGSQGSKNLRGLREPIDQLVNKLDLLASEAHAFVQRMGFWHVIQNDCKKLLGVVEKLKSQATFDIREQDALLRTARDAGKALVQASSNMVKANEKAEGEVQRKLERLVALKVQRKASNAIEAVQSQSNCEI